MADLPRSPDTSDGTSVGADPGPNTSTPRWVKVFGIIALVLVLLFGAHMLFDGSSHGPGRHTPPGDAGGQIPPSSVTLSSASQSPVASCRSRVATRRDDDDTPPA